MKPKRIFVIIAIVFLILAMSFPAMANNNPEPHYQTGFYWTEYHSSMPAIKVYGDCCSGNGDMAIWGPQPDALAIVYVMHKSSVDVIASINLNTTDNVRSILSQGSSGTNIRSYPQTKASPPGVTLAMINAELEERFPARISGAANADAVTGGFAFPRWYSGTINGAVTVSLEGVYILHYGTMPASTPTTTGTATATATPFCDETAGTYRSVDLLATGTITSGKLTADQALIDDVNHYVIDFTLTASSPARMDGYNTGQLSIGVDDPGTLRDNNYPATYTVVVNGNTFSTNTGGSIPVSLAGGTALTISYHATIPGSFSMVDNMAVAYATIRLPTYLDAGKNLLCDPGMEDYPDSSYWKQMDYDGKYWGRLNYGFSDPIENFTNGKAYCSDGMQAVGSFFVSSGALWYNGSPIKQHFYWSGGVAQWKFRAAAGHLGITAHVYIQDNAGTNVADLYNGALPGFFTLPAWNLYTGSVDLDASEYDIVLDIGSSGVSTTAYFDDLAIGSEIEIDCQEDFRQVPTSASPTATGTGIPTITSTYGKTVIATGTGTITRTATKTPGPGTITSTARPTRTTTPFRTFTPGDGPPATTTATPYGTPQVGGTPEIGGDLPPDGMNPGAGICSQPVNAWSLSWWVDYEFCRLFYSVSWQDGHSATLVAVPGEFSNREPMASINEITSGINTVSTEIAVEIGANPGFVQSGTPNQDMFKAAPNSPWNGAPLQFGPLPSPGDTPTWSSYCSHKMLTTLGSFMAPGFCFTLNLLRDLGMLLWFQFLIDLVCLVGMIRTTMITIRFYPLLYAGGNTGGGEQK